MRIYIQWATVIPQDWIEIDSSEWSDLPKRDEPSGGEVIDGTPGWLAALNVQGMRFASDHVAVRDFGAQGVTVTTWNDDPQDRSPGLFVGKVWTIPPLQPDPKLGGHLNTAITFEVYAGRDALPQFVGDDVAVELRGAFRWQDFTPPSRALTRHGIWLPEQAWEAHRAVQSVRSWRQS